MKKIQIILASLLIAVGMGAAFSPTLFAAQDAAKNAACEGIALTGGKCDSDDKKDSSNKINGIIRTVINLFSLVVGVAAVIMVIVGGFKYITSSGDSTAVNGAKNTILYALVGLVIVLLAQVIVQFVIGKV